MRPEVGAIDACAALHITDAGGFCAVADASEARHPWPNISIDTQDTFTRVTSAFATDRHDTGNEMCDFGNGLLRHCGRKDSSDGNLRCDRARHPALLLLIRAR